MNYRTITNSRNKNGRSPATHKPIIKPLNNIINIERLLLTGLRPLAPKSPRQSFDHQVWKACS